ncbi:putative xyloglucan endotransglucosylase/hydrolase protein 27 [Capsicum annuum]|nr:putative xyloglucan endotransglucosylase/hydrolase protein 27 [Capsicum annuum]KAF3662289.1 putative xyloglucan endotransglucosylase/hydrolase protein 27 [Capsicum annuum]
MRRNLSALPTLNRNLRDEKHPLLEVRLNEPFATPSGVYLRAIFSLPNELSIIKILQEFPDETVKSTKEYLRSLIAIPEKKDFLVSLQNKLNQRSDLTIETLSKCNKTQLEIFVAIKMGYRIFLSLENHLQATELIEIFSLERFRNICCKRALPVVNYKCKICPRNKGFCSECLCQVCFNFDYASNTCCWVGCDACAHWCHVVCPV